jgi:predicted DNA-binding protein
MSGSKRYSYRLGDTRKRRLNKIEDDIQKDSRAAAIDEATKHYLRAREDLEDIAEELEEEFQERADRHALGTWELDVTVEVED